MLFWAIVCVIGFSVLVILQGASKRKREDDNRLREIQRKIEANEKAKQKKSDKQKSK